MSADHPKYPGVPIDFPVGPIPSALAGVQPKVNLVEEDDQYYASGTSPSEVSEAFETCENLAQKFVAYCLEKEKGIRHAGSNTPAHAVKFAHERLVHACAVRVDRPADRWFAELAGTPGLNAGDP